MAYRDSVPPKRQRGTKHRQRRARRNHTPATNTKLPRLLMYEESLEFTADQYEYLMGNVRRLLPVITTKGAFDEDGNYHQED